MKKQQGAALIVVLSMLTMSLMLGLSGMQSSLVEERLAGNYKAATEVQMGAEKAASLGWSNIESAVYEDVSVDYVNGMGWDSFINDEEFSNSKVSGGCESGVKCYYRYINDGGRFYIASMGAIGENSTESDLLLVEVIDGSGDTPFDEAVVGCEAVSMTGSGDVKGGVISGGDVDLSGGVFPPARISAAGNINYPSWWDGDSTYSEAISGYDDDYDFGDCDELGVLADDGSPGEMFDDVWADESLISASEWFDKNGCSYCYSENNNKFTFSGGRDNQDASRTVIGSKGEGAVIGVNKDVSSGGRLEELYVEGDVKLIVDGDFDLGDNTLLRVSDDASLEIYVTGKTRLGGGANLLAGQEFVRESDGGENRPAVVIYSSYTQSGGNPGVILSGGNDSHAVVYAPYSHARITGSGALYGSIRAKEVDLRGSGLVDYSDDLDLVSGSDDGFSIINWR